MLHSYSPLRYPSCMQDADIFTRVWVNISSPLSWALSRYILVRKRTGSLGCKDFQAIAFCALFALRSGGVKVSLLHAFLLRSPESRRTAARNVRMTADSGSAGLPGPVGVVVFSPHLAQNSREENVVQSFWGSACISRSKQEKRGAAWCKRPQQNLAVWSV